MVNFVVGAAIICKILIAESTVKEITNSEILENPSFSVSVEEDSDKTKNKPKLKYRIVEGFVTSVYEKGYLKEVENSKFKYDTIKTLFVKTDDIERIVVDSNSCMLKEDNFKEEKIVKEQNIVEEPVKESIEKIEYEVFYGDKIQKKESIKLTEKEKKEIEQIANQINKKIESEPKTFNQEKSIKEVSLKQNESKIEEIQKEEMIEKEIDPSLSETKKQTISKEELFKKMEEKVEVAVEKDSLKDQTKEKGKIEPTKEKGSSFFNLKKVNDAPSERVSPDKSTSENVMTIMKEI